MIQANELRLNNWAIHPASDTEIQLTEIDIIQIMERSQDGLNQNYEPIPLTPEWLERAGFVKGEHDWYSTIYHSGDMITEVNEIGINLESGRCSISHIGYTNAPFKQSYCVYCGKEVVYLHQLQNLYFALTGTELEFK